MNVDLATTDVEARPHFNLEHILNGGAAIDALGLGKAEIEAFYAVAHRDLSVGDYDGAEKMFRLLCMLDHRESRFWMGLGATLQSKRELEAAILAYSAVAEVGDPTPYAPLHAAECYIGLHLFEEAISGLSAAATLARGHVRAKEIADRIQGLRDVIQWHLDQALTDDDLESKGAD